MTKRQRRAVEQRLGAALFDAVGLLVRQYFDGGAEESVETLRGEKNKSFDEGRFFALMGEKGGETAAPLRAGEEESLLRETFRESEPLSLAARGGERAAAFPRAATAADDTGVSARTLSEQFERDARRYDGGFEL